MTEKQNIGDWVYADEEDSNHWMPADSREDAIAKGKKYVNEFCNPKQNYCYIARLTIGPTEFDISANDILELLAYDAPEGWLDDKVTKEQEDELSDFLHGWLERHNIKPDWLDVGESVKIEFERD